MMLGSIRKDGVLLPKCVALISAAALLQLLGFAFRITILNFAGSQSMAIYQLVMNAYSVLMAISLQGVVLASSRQAAALASSGREDRVFYLRRESRKLFLMLFVLAASLVLLFPNFVAAHLLGDERTRSGLLLLLICILLTGFENTGKAVFLGTQSVAPANISEVSELGIRILSCLFLLPLVKDRDPGFAAALIVCAMIISECFSVVFLNFCFQKRFKKGPKPTDKEQSLLQKELRKTAIPISFSSVLNKLLFSLDNLLIPSMLMLGGCDRASALSGFAMLFSMAVPLVTLPSCLIIPVGGLVLPRIAGSYVTGKEADCLRKGAKLLQLVGLAAIPYLLWVSVFASPVSLLIYQDASPGPYLPLLALATLFEYYEIASANLLNGLGRTIPASFSIVAEGLILLAGTVLLIPPLGLTGFCLAKLLSTFLAAGINILVLRKTIPLKLRIFNWMGRPLIASAAALLPAAGIFYLFRQSALPAVLFAGVLFFLCYGLVLRLLGTKWFSYFTEHFWA